MYLKFYPLSIPSINLMIMQVNSRGGGVNSGMMMLHGGNLVPLDTNFGKFLLPLTLPYRYFSYGHGSPQAPYMAKATQVPNMTSTPSMSVAPHLI